MCTHRIGECDGGITAVSADERRIFHPTASPELNLVEATEAEMEEDWRQNSEKDERENHHLPRKESSRNRFWFRS